MIDLQWLAILLLGLLSWGSAAHALLNKREPRAALAWIAVCLISPLLGPLLYFFFGINRVHIQGHRLGGSLPLLLRTGFARAARQVEPAAPPSSTPAAYQPFAGLSDRITHRPLLPGHLVEPLENGEEAFPAMLEAIRAARRTLYLSTYILETNRTGRTFIAALRDAVERGVDVRVLIDGVGEWYSWPRAGVLLKHAGVPVARFLPPKLLPPSFLVNLRNHTKILVADGLVGFTGGMNIGDRYLAGNLDNPSRVEDIHFRVTGPVVAQMEQVFLADWSFCADGAAPPESRPSPAGEAYCRAVVDGPTGDLDRLTMILTGAVASARQRVFIMTPYFLPPRELIGALQAAALRGIDVQVVLPSKNNLPYVKWASDNMLWELLQNGIRVFYQPPPFVHTKLFLVDDFYALIGSANLDPRSLRLNFEMVLEVFDPVLNSRLSARFGEAVARSRETSLAEMDRRSLPVRIRDSLCWLFTPYL